MPVPPRQSPTRAPTLFAFCSMAALCLLSVVVPAPAQVTLDGAVPAHLRKLPVEAPPEAPPSPTQPKAVRTAFTVQVGAYRNRLSALAARDKLSRDGGDARLLPIEIDDEVLYRVVSGAFEQRSEAVAHAERLHAMGYATYVRSTEVEVAVAPRPKSGPPSASVDASHIFKETLEPTATVKLVESLGGTAAEDRAGRLSRVNDERRPDDQLTVDVFGKPLTIGGEIGFDSEYRDDFSLGTRDDEQVRLEANAELELLYRPADNTAIFVEGTVTQNARYRLEEDNSSYDNDLRRGQTWIFFDRIAGSGFGFQVGRQRMRDKREWWWDENLDAVRLHYYSDKGLHAQLAVAQEMFEKSVDEEGIKSEDEDIFRAFAQLRWDYMKDQRFELFFLYQNDHSDSWEPGDELAGDQEDESDADLIWAGLRAAGRVRLDNSHKIYYWVDTGFVTGNEDVYDFDDTDTGIEVDDRFRRDVLGWAVDIGTTWRTKWEPELSFTLGYAVGSGDRDGSDSDSYDKNYRQTGLQDNNNKFRGVDRFRYYGELLDPELSNLHITTAAVGLPLLQNSSVELLHHYYKQIYEAPFLRDDGISVRPDGDDRDIGHEFDLVLGIEEWEQFEIEAVASVFIAGDAYGSESGKTAQSFSLSLDWNF